ncbi:Rieske (2Fe-2S) protein [Calidifontibacter sp. DB0510]|uniref:Cytochrome bc1 complex Rieske iron-sulfur subunit n=1 Tax=Metallococcus carri TaxID=1656884 RepID=A0A967E873_9MICO|nr:Rieske (2Fe-2S) protein [Metallococcus carri]NHN54917.1 Rieske (2Fe-2S) protein [Metallococcus carri]NOP37263.1 Rieske (2Fe-2S) protein [Calidifontibacter sp. DB2511S]
MTAEDKTPRRSVLGGAGIAAAGVLGGATLAGCGGSDGGATATGTGLPEPTGSATSSTAAPVPASKVPDGGGYIDTAANVVLTQPATGEFKAFSAVCTHQGCSVSSVEGQKIVCPCHGSEFSIRDGSVLNGPATQPLAARKVTRSGANLIIS